MKLRVTILFSFILSLVLSVTVNADSKSKKDLNLVLNEITVEDNIIVPKIDGFVNIREGKSSSSDIVGRLLPDSYAKEISGGTQEWIHVKSGDVEGYVSSSCVYRSKDIKHVIDSNPNKFSIKVKFNEVTGGYETKDSMREDNFLYTIKVKLRDNAQLYKTPFLCDTRNDIMRKESYITVVKDAVITSEKASTSKSSIVKEVKKGTQMKVVSFEDNYIKVKCGYINKNSVKVYLKDVGISNLVDKSEVDYSRKYKLIGREGKFLSIKVGGNIYYVRVNDTDLSCEPVDSKAKVVVDAGKLYDVVEYNKDYIKVRIDNNDYYVKATNYYAFVVFEDAIPFSLDVDNNRTSDRGSSIYKYNYKFGTENATSKRDKIISYALKFLGNPYVWGGTSLVNGADCSGYCQSILKHFDIDISRTTRTQVAEAGGKHIEKVKDLRPGDLIYYTRDGSKPYHVVMYLGKGKCVNASSRRTGICISDVKYDRILTMKNYID